jgi:hypothetical protein
VFSSAAELHEAVNVLTRLVCALELWKFTEGRREKRDRERRARTAG